MKKLFFGAWIALLGVSLSFGITNEIWIYGGAAKSGYEGSFNKYKYTDPSTSPVTFVYETKQAKSEYGSSFGIKYRLFPDYFGFALDASIGTQNSEFMRINNFEFVSGLAFGDISSIGSFRIKPLGFGLNMLSFDPNFVGQIGAQNFVKKLEDSDGNDIFAKYYSYYANVEDIYSIFYKGGVEYEKRFSDFSVGVGAYYQQSFLSFSILDDEYSEVDYLVYQYEPKGIEINAHLNYYFWKFLALGASVSYSKIKDKFYGNDEIYLNDGIKAMLGVGFSF